ncbi:MBL fold metallo-hydrolase [Dolichospermum sp. ST_sed1]|nr:MBL fold metallo-hydrolase [Dolichospermum sp. ST_sed1]MDD1428328.1 MBL fold metallo-hydrolase [Dolichospermum sp. ST_sed9]MDD1429928.1 MBL fold metallo-hydrolase [Dolichospermum sp. ST_sed6]MDD1437950.1 MBL fold metallo-hydrolase [Dolichospermum sp. ST_sed10]MDD1443804.1 MBL fold metallo-hydrolase [Dolichospermum sp. ST_sed3]MDD1445497.1 MBL fold metallo-hydrolase [Dolichospermum sp. ST_sed8]MDD1455136.1 MBL fold metallo-hydrolase [Dolichospermum sp. ST_sed7]MDD1461099.1 MBL fold metallo
MDNISIDAVETSNELECLPYSVQHQDEGVCLLVRMGSHRILLDFGLTNISPVAQNLTESAESGTSPMPADLVLISHAHPDHARGLLTLHQAFPLLPIYASEVTTKLLPLNWLEEEIPRISSFCQALPLRSPIEIRENLIVELFPAGHLPGAVVILLTYHTPNRDYKLLYTGDFFLSNSRLVEGLRLDELRGLNLDVLLIEGSYGTSRHPHRRNQENQLAERIHRAISAAGTDESYSVILPAPALGLGQELLMLLRSHHHFTGRDLDIWVDGAVAAGCDAYLELLPHFPASVQNFARHQPLFWDERVKPRVRRLKPENLATLGTSPCIVITDSSADLRKYCQADRGNWLILLPEKIDIKVNQEYLAPTKVESYLLAQHSDGPGTTQLIHNLRPQHVIFVHGSPSYLADLTCLEELQNRYHVHSPAAGTLVELPIGETFLQPAPPEINYEGELTELGTVITITLPDAVTADPRWRQFADTGLIEARWQGEDLVFRGLSPRELLNSNNLRPNSGDVACCGSCRHQRGQRCWNPAAPLYNFKVTLDGYCPAFERLI